MRHIFGKSPPGERISDYSDYYNPNDNHAAHSARNCKFVRTLRHVGLYHLSFTSRAADFSLRRENYIRRNAA